MALAPEGNWSGHVPFAKDLVRAMEPGCIVELGTHSGESYFSFCEAVQENGFATRCFALDTWTGDEHAGFYGEDVYQKVESHNRSEYKAFSTLLRTTFDEAANQFGPESIDLLHIDGLHTYSAVKHDFETWFPKVKPGGIALLHDISVRHGGFEVWRFWEELSQQHLHFEFRHSWGLGVLLKPGGDTQVSDFARLLFAADAETAERIRTQYSNARVGQHYCQVFFGIPETGFEEKSSALSNIEPGVWQTHRLDLPRGLPNGMLRIDPVNRAALIEISHIVVRGSNTETALDLSQLSCSGQLMPYPAGESGRFFGWADDPQLIAALLPCNSPLQLEIAMRVQFDLEPLRVPLSEFAGLRIRASKAEHRSSRLEWDLSALETQADYHRKEGSFWKGLRDIEGFVDRVVWEGRLAGAVLLIARHGEIASHRAFGWLDREAGKPMQLDALFYVLSMTKAITCAALLTLVDEGKVSLSDPVEQWLPEFRAVRFADGRKPQTPPLLWQCMAHSSGLLDTFPESFLKSPFTLPDLVSVGARNHMGCEPGQGWAYCNLGFAVLGRVIELASSQPYLEFVKERILDPVGMTSSFFRIPAEHQHRLAAISRLTDAAVTQYDWNPFETAPDYVAPENGLRTTALDLWRFYELIRRGGMANGHRVLSEASALKMRSVQTGTHNAGFLPGMGYGYGLSLVTQPTGMFRNHSPGTFGHGSFLQAHAWVDPVKGVSGLLFHHTRADPLVVVPEMEEFLPMLGALQ